MLDIGRQAHLALHLPFTMSTIPLLVAFNLDGNTAISGCSRSQVDVISFQIVVHDRLASQVILGRNFFPTILRPLAKVGRGRSLRYNFQAPIFSTGLASVGCLAGSLLQDLFQKLVQLSGYFGRFRRLQS